MAFSSLFGYNGIRCLQILIRYFEELKKFRYVGLKLLDAISDLAVTIHLKGKG